MENRPVQWSALRARLPGAIFITLCILLIIFSQLNVYSMYPRIDIQLRDGRVRGNNYVMLMTSRVHNLSRLNYSWPSVSTDFHAFTPSEGRIVDSRRFSLEQPPEDGTYQNGVLNATHGYASANAVQTFSDSRKYSTRTAVCVSGQVRSLKLHPGSPTWPGRNARLKSKWDFSTFQKGSGTVADSLQKNLFSAFDEFDVFMTISTREGPREPAVGDLSACEPLRPKKPGSSLFCEVIREKARTLHPDGIWKNYYYANTGLHQGLLQQLYGMYRCSLMIRRHMIDSGTEYDYMVRLRPDMWMHLPMPSIKSIVQSRKVIKYAHKMYYPGGNEDWFGVGHADAMLPYFERYLGLQNVGIDVLEGGKRWGAENFVTKYMAQQYNVTLMPDSRIAAGIVKPTTRGAPSTP